MTKVLFIDHREKSGLEDLVKSYCDKNNLFYQVRENLITDYAFSSVGIEAKSIQDYMGSLHSGHLERQLQNMDDNYNTMILLVWGTVDKYVVEARKGGRKIPFQRAWSSFIGSLARFTTDYDISVIIFSDRSSAARYICKRFQKHGTLGSSSTYRLMRKTASEDKRIDTLRAAGCSEAIAKRLLERFGSIAEIAGLPENELQTVEGVGKIRAKRLSLCLNSEEAVADERMKMTRA
tara:strand:+ start:2758 stop:3462 length:705 start_codon:yes stop_codon:yes gene_type:complete